MQIWRDLGHGSDAHRLEKMIGARIAPESAVEVELSRKKRKNTGFVPVLKKISKNDKHKDQRWRVRTQDLSHSKRSLNH